MATTQIIPVAINFPAADGTAGTQQAMVAYEDMWLVIIGPCQLYGYVETSDAYGVDWVREFEIGDLGPPAVPLTLLANQAEKWELSTTAYYVRIYRTTLVAGTPTVRLEARY